MTAARCHHPRSAVERLYLPRDKGGRGLLSVEELHDRVYTGFAAYLNTSSSRFLKCVVEHNLHKWRGTHLKSAVTILSRYGIESEISDKGAIIIDGTEQKGYKLGQLIKSRAAEQRRLRLRDKQLHSQIWEVIDTQEADRGTWQWLKDWRIGSDVEASLLAIQDGIVWTGNYQKAVAKVRGVNDVCRLCGEPKETLSHLLASCKSLLGTVIKSRHDDCARVIYYTVAKQLGLLPTVVRWWDRSAVQHVLENEEWKMLWDHPFRTDRTLEFTRPDIVIENTRTHEGWIVEIGVCLDFNLKAKMAEKKSKYVPLAIELCKLRGWTRWKTIAVVVGATGTFPSKLTSEVCKLPHTSEGDVVKILQDVQHAVIYSAVNIVRNVVKD